VVSHELRTPLTSITGSLTLMRETNLSKDPEKADRMLDIAYKNSKRLSKLINDLLDIQKMEARKMVYHFAPVDLGQLLNDAAQSITPYADQYEIVVRTDPPPFPLTIRADHERMMQVLDNLLSNAVKFSHEGGYVELSARLVDGCAMLAVRDYGVGIPNGERHQIFGKFTQVDTPTVAILRARASVSPLRVRSSKTTVLQSILTALWGKAPVFTPSFPFVTLRTTSASNCHKRAHHEGANHVSRRSSGQIRPPAPPLHVWPAAARSGNRRLHRHSVRAWRGPSRTGRPPSCGP
jgi:hypothetical protein